MSRRNELRGFLPKTSRDIYAIIQPSGSVDSVARIRTEGGFALYRAFDEETRFSCGRHLLCASRMISSARIRTQGQPAADAPDSPGRDAGRRRRLRVVPSGHPRRVEERPPQQNDPAGERRPASRAIFDSTDHPARPAVSVARRWRRRTSSHESNITGTPREHRVEFTLGSQAHSALPDHDRERPDHRAHPELGRRAAHLVRQHGDRPS